MVIDLLLLFLFVGIVEIGFLVLLICVLIRLGIVYLMGSLVLCVVCCIGGTAGDCIDLRIIGDEAFMCLKVSARVFE